MPEAIRRWWISPPIRRSWISRSALDPSPFFWDEGPGSAQSAQVDRPFRSPAVSRKAPAALTRVMNENEDLISRLRAFGRRPVSSEVAGPHLAAMEEAVDAPGARVGAHRLKIVAAFVVGLMAGTSGLATAGALPNGAQEVAHRTFGAVGIKVPHGDRYWGPECAGEAKKNHGQYVRSQPKDKRAEAAASRCGKPVQAGDDDGIGDGTGAGCQGPPPWAGKGKPDAAAKAARKQACGQGKDEKSGDQKGSEAPGPS